MRSRILQYERNLVFYDFLTQFSVKKPNKKPIFSLFTIKIQNLQINDIKQTCLNLVSIQLIGNNYVLCKSQQDISNLTLKVNGNNAYFVLENIALLACKTRVEKFTLSQNELRIRIKNFLNIVEYFTLDSKLLKFLENTPNKNLKLIFLCQFINSKNSSTILYFKKSLGVPF
uniref:Uncharacterized protein n=1 Tax=Pyropia pulchra TaxID=60925 RepID=A0A7D5DPQ4_9RHOD|nr:hypothetical protein [Pyropia pulchra]